MLVGCCETDLLDFIRPPESRFLIELKCNTIYIIYYRLYKMRHISGGIDIL